MQELISMTCKGKNVMGDSELTVSPNLPMFFSPTNSARRLEGTGVTVNALHPGYVDTGIPLSSGFLGRVAKLSAQFFAQKPKAGAQTSIYLAVSPDVEGVTGKYFVDCKSIDSSPESYDKSVAERLWQVSLRLTGTSE